MSEKVTGYILLGVGIVIMIFSLINIYFVFTKRADPINLFSFPSISMDLGTAIGGSLSAEQKALMAKQLPNGIKQEILPATILNQSANIAAHLFLMGFVLNVGYKIASLGINLLRPIVVHAKSEK